ncbi:unnamed protein product [Linum trigynum]|uniref:Hyaluronan/mRNA-binding protein domain-containing protein n=1 Tax=Linum trigynum TaxID=586398 RepID=A0AAV2GDZ5_9ROSI
MNGGERKGSGNMQWGNRFHTLSETKEEAVNDKVEHEETMKEVGTKESNVEKDKLTVGKKKDKQVQNPTTGVMTSKPVAVKEGKCDGDHQTRQKQGLGT